MQLNGRTSLRATELTLNGERSPLVDGVLGWWQSSLAAGRKTHLCRVRQHIRVYATNAFGQFTNTGATLNTELNNAQRHWNWTENRVKYVCKAVKCNCPGSANWAPSRGQLFCNVHINMATASSDVRKGRLVVPGRGTLQPRGCDTNSLSASAQQRAIQDEAISKSLPCLASFALLAMVRDGLPDWLTASRPPLSTCHPARRLHSH